jgi:hypothetical protein
VSKCLQFAGLPLGSANMVSKKKIKIKTKKLKD